MGAATAEKCLSRRASNRTAEIYLADTERHESRMAWKGSNIFFTKTANLNLHCEFFYGIIIAKNRIKWHGHENVSFLVFLHSTFPTINKLISKYRELKKL